ncbi:MAG: hypothetical protein EOO38_11635 [Cytophagaceae bacterium]|nr:MAG: hypothetical protein EOO38_11635 [Cytophagaceae bacterium]
MARKRRNHTAEFRDNVIKLVLDGGLKASAVAKDHDLAPSLVAGWVRQRHIDLGENPRQQPTSTEREELQRLRREKRDLELELAFVKKTVIYLASLKK